MYTLYDFDNNSLKKYDDFNEFSKLLPVTINNQCINMYIGEKMKHLSYKEQKIMKDVAASIFIRNNFFFSTRTLNTTEIESLKANDLSISLNFKDAVSDLASIYRNYKGLEDYDYIVYNFNLDDSKLILSIKIISLRNSSLSIRRDRHFAIDDVLSVL